MLVCCTINSMKKGVAFFKATPFPHTVQWNMLFYGPACSCIGSCLEIIYINCDPNSARECV